MRDAPDEPVPGLAEVGRGTPRARRNARNVLTFIVGAALLGAAVWAVARHGGELARAWGSVRSAPPWLLALVFVLPIVTWLVTSAALWILTRRHGPVRYAEMAALIASAWLLNQIPLIRAGTVGRVAYHKTVNGIAVRDSVRVVIIGAIATVVSMGIVLAAALWAGPGATPARLAAAGGAPTAAFLVGVFAAWRVDPVSGVWRVIAAVGLRFVEGLLWCARYWVLFRVIGVPLDPVGAAVLAAVTQLVSMGPVQLGLEEWATGMVAAMLPSELIGIVRDGHASGGAALEAATPGILAELANRGAELAIVLPLGLASILWLWRTAPSRRAARLAGQAGDGRPARGPAV